ncbi:MAG TPA: hypothetical protein VHY83_07590 [Solirubrobacteraceae bacterium]|nr:hypothetical protein [Solirubrobacteraceae bacterium]
MQIRLFGRGAHGSMPQASIAPVVMAASTVLRLQTIVSRALGERLRVGGISVPRDHRHVLVEQPVSRLLIARRP